ncbi:MAG: FapA family protein [Planctomycetota bacterium]
MDEKSEPKVEIADNGLSASLVLPEDFDRATLSIELCQKLLKQEGVAPDTIVQQNIEAYLAKAEAAEPGPFEAVIARAAPAIHGVDAFIEWRLKSGGGDEQPQEEAKEQGDAPRDGASEEKDEAKCFYSVSNFNVVKSGDVLGKYHPEVPGTEGRDVRGKVLATRTAKPLDLKHDETIGIDEQQNVVAKADGVLIRDRESAHISDTIEVDENVDFNTGNIDFHGNILVRQGVKDCFIVKATENIEVRGLIEAATLIAGKDLHAKGGFAGREQGVAKVEGNLYGKYLDAVETQIDGDLCVEREIINCNNTVLGSINCPRGAIIGGCTQVSGSVELMDLGAMAQPITELQIGVLPLLDPLIAELTKLVEHLVEERGKLLDEQEMITSNSGARIAPTLQANLEEISRSMGKLQLQLDRAEPSLERVRGRADMLRQIDVKINRRLHPNALIVCGGYRYRITNEIKGPIHITANKRGQLEYQRGEDKPVLLSTESELRTAA